MRTEVLRIERPGLGASLQDLGLTGWRRFGVPPGGAMDDHAAVFANRLLDNPPEAPVLELLLQGAALTMLDDAWIALTGAEAGADLERWRAIRIAQGDVIEFPFNQSGVWIYLAVEGGFEAGAECPPSATHARQRIGTPLAAGTILRRKTPLHFTLPSGVAGRTVAWDELRAYDHPPVFRLWRGPQWEEFDPKERRLLFETEWTVTSQSNRVGYRLDGVSLKPGGVEIVSEPVQVGTVQVPESGYPIVTMRDGPTVGGYPKLGMIDPEQVAWLAQCRPGQVIRFQPVQSDGV